MTNELYFKNAAEIGNLYLEYIFLEFDLEPIFFTCVDDKDQLYLCLCSEIRGEQKWIISQCCLDVLEMLIEDRIDMADALCKPELLTLVTRDLQGRDNSFVVQTKDVDRLDLPKEGTSLKCNKENAWDYLNSKKMMKRSGQLQSEFRIDLIIRNMKTQSDILCDLSYQTIDNRCERHWVYMEYLSAYKNLIGQEREYHITQQDTYVDVSDKKKTNSIDGDYLQAA